MATATTQEQDQRKAVAEIAPELFKKLQKLERAERLRKWKMGRMADPDIRQARREIWIEIWAEWGVER